MKLSITGAGHCSIPVEMGNSIVESKICSKDFSYLCRYFYENPFALRCELGMGDSDEEYMTNAERRALEIYDILFPQGADAIIFNYWQYDYADTGEAEIHYFDADDDVEGILENRIEEAANSLRFLSEYQLKYRHRTVRNMATFDSKEDEEYGRTCRHRIICYSDGIGFPHKELIRKELNGEGFAVSFVSFDNECIYSVYDARGCDVVFMTRGKLREFYHRLQPYFLEYDVLEMEKRYHGE